ncbi:MAG: chemotaxis response regulator protein-glutamate methylesterase [Planctomycetes bacterium]|nr:chemotaxis response regulator protein-glutamate methylesterase [Planctomycetota bacterium]
MIRVLIVDDSAVVRRVLTDELSKAGDIEVVGTAMDPYVARDKIVALKPDVVTLDVEMPRMDGLTFLGKLMRYHPLPVLILSSISPRGSENAIRALELGALDVIQKPSAISLGNVIGDLIEKIRVASRSRTIPRLTTLPPAAKPAESEDLPVLCTTDKVLAIGASTGGTEAIKAVLSRLPVSTPGTVIVQHMPIHFTKAFASRLNELCSMEVREAEGGEILRPGLALLAPGNKHLVIRRNGARYVADVRDGPAVFHQRPSVEVLFNSVAKNVGRNAVGVLLTGMGADGGRGLLAMREAGAETIAQDEASCVVYGMPKVAVELGGACSVLPLDAIPAAILKIFKRTVPA